MGAWIETSYAPYHGYLRKSHPTWVRGLKPEEKWDELNPLAMSHPTWVRGLKQHVFCGYRIIYKSHPTWVRGLKQGDKGDQGIQGPVASYMGAWIET